MLWRTTRQSGQLKDIVGAGQSAVKDALSKKCIVKNDYLINIVTVVVVSMVIFVGNNASLSSGDTKNYMHINSCLSWWT